MGGSARVLQNLSITPCDASVSWRVSGPWRTVPPAVDGTAHASATCAWARRPGRRRGSWHPAGRARLPGRGLLPAPTGTRRGLLPDHAAAVQGRSSVRSSQPRVSRPYQLRPFVARNCDHRGARRHGTATGARVITGQWRWRWDLNPRKTCAFTRFRVLRTTVHHRPPAFVTSPDKRPWSPVNRRERQ